jgi:ABC-type nitrate/sulfonate/bicarbonate transport system ATPase subunit
MTAITSSIDISTRPLLTIDRCSLDLPGSNGEPLEVLRNVSLSVNAGEFVSIIGPSGCGKSTLLNIVSGLMSPDAGIVALHGDPSAKRLGDVAYMQQRDLLMPWRDVLDNATLGLELNGVSRSDRRSRALEQLPTFGLEGFDLAYPSQLSGGMRQRVALMRTTLQQHDLLLLDEPFGALDSMTRTDLQRWLVGLFESSDMGVLLVTHDVEEALILSDRVIVMSGRPGHNAGELVVDLRRPRVDTDVTDERFIALKRELLQMLATVRAAI